MLGQWKNFDELETYLTLDELVEIYNAIAERENQRMEFQAQIAGAEMKSSKSKKPDNKQQADTTGKETLADRLRRRKREQQIESASSGKKTEFSHGVGYQVIGG